MVQNPLKKTTIVCHSTKYKKKKKSKTLQQKITKQIHKSILNMYKNKLKKQEINCIDLFLNLELP